MIFSSDHLMVVPTHYFYLAFQTKALDDKLGVGHEITAKKNKIYDQHKLL